MEKLYPESLIQVLISTSSSPPHTMLSSFTVSLLSGAAAGTSADLFFFPIDTLKTRLQAKGGFFANGGYRGIYRGVGSAIVASAPGAALFFVTYDTLKRDAKPFIQKWLPSGNAQLADTLTHMFASTMGEVAACTIRVPAEVVKQRAQTSAASLSSYATLKVILRNENGAGLRRNLYRGWSTTIMREVPFTCIQFPLYEYFKKVWASSNNASSPKQQALAPWKGAICGSVAGAIAAAVTTPLDFLKTRVMLHNGPVSATRLARDILHDEGALVFLSGIGPRTMWISAGGAVFLGMYETVHYMLTQ